MSGEHGILPRMNTIRTLHGGRQGLGIPRFPALLVGLAIGLLGACSDNGGGFFGNTTGQPPGSGCDPNSTEEACYKQVRVKCDPGTNRFVELEVCPNGTTCKERVHKTQKTKREAVCDGTPIEDPDADAGGGGNDAGPQDTGPTGGADKDDPVCKRWIADRADMVEGKWDGEFDKCTIGDIDDAGRTKALKILNLYRYLAGLPEVKTDKELNEKAQKCAVLMAANDDLSHTPPKTWKCWTEDGFEAAEASNLSTAPGILAVDRFMIDEGQVNFKALGHRRGILGKQLGPVGLGSTNDTPDAKGQASCMWIHGKGDAKYEWMAWPPDGKIPYKAFWPHKSKGHASLDDTGWSIQSDDIDFAKATIQVKAGLTELKVKTRVLDQNLSTKYAMAFAPDGWKTEAGTTYEVNVGGIPKPFTYFVKVLECE